MREKVLKLVVAFEETTDAIEAEQYFQKQKIEGRMIPLPGAICAGCGLAWTSSLKEREFIEKQIQEGNISCLLYTSPSPRDQRGSRMPSSA